MKKINPFVSSAKAANHAFTGVQNALKLESNPDLAFYNRLGPKDFETIQRMYGMDGLARYVQNMEAQRIGGKRHG